MRREQATALAMGVAFVFAAVAAVVVPFGVVGGLGFLIGRWSA